MDLAAIVLPDDTEEDLSLWLADALDDLPFAELRMFREGRTERLEDLANGLVKLGLPGLRSTLYR